MIDVADNGVPVLLMFVSDGGAGEPAIGNEVAAATTLQSAYRGHAVRHGGSTAGGLDKTTERLLGSVYANLREHDALVEKMRQRIEHESAVAIQMCARERFNWSHQK